jgi:hypothetical protein
VRASSKAHIEDQRPHLDPGSLADHLERWALRREKVLALLDPRLASSARALVRRCRALSEQGFSPDDHPGTTLAGDLEWLEIREETVGLLRKSSTSRCASLGAVQRIAER